MNVLCARIWDQDKKPTTQRIEQLWQSYVDEEKSKTIAELNQLTLNQYRVLNAIAHGNTTKLMSQDFLSTIEIPSSSVVKALNYLEKQNYIYKKESVYQLVDPLIQTSLLTFSVE